jgi:hypothetical protein
MNNHPIEGRLRDALTAHAETISASPDAWQHIQAKDARLPGQQHGRSGPLGAGWLARHSVRGRAVLSAGVAAVAATVTAVTLTIGSAPPALATVTTALTRTLTQSYHLTEQESEYYIVDGRIRYPSHGTCTSVADPARHLEEMASCAWGPADREVGGYTYIYITDPVDHPGRHWWRTPTASLRQLTSINGFIAATPQQMLSAIKKAATVTVAGPASGPGWTGTRYAFRVSSAFRFSGGPSGMGQKLTGTVDVDRQGRARALVLTIRMTGAINVFVTTQALTFSDFGARVTVTPPPADQTFSGP